MKTDDEIPLYLPTASSALSKSTDKKAAKNEEKGLGRWVFDKGSRKRYYISLNGSVHSGQEANQKAREDKDLALQPGISMRNQLCILMKAMTIPTAPALHLNRLESWGLPGSIIQRYNQRGVTHLFDWQVECLLRETVRNHTLLSLPPFLVMIINLSQPTLLFVPCALHYTHIS